MQKSSARGVTAMFIAVAVFSFMDSALKMFAQHYPALQVSAIRALASLPFILLPLAFSGRLAELRPVTPAMHLLRGVLGVFMMATFVYAVRNQSLSSVYAIYMVAPLMIVALSALLLRERADLGRWLAVLVGMAGVLVILRPAPGSVSLLAGLAAASSALAYAFAAITARQLTRTDRSVSISFSFLLLMALIAGALALPGWVEIQREHWLWIGATGALGAAGQHYIIEAFRHAPASTVAPIEYTALLWGVGIDRVFWGLTPGLSVLAGAVLVVAAGLYVAWRERSAAR